LIAGGGSGIAGSGDASVGDGASGSGGASLGDGASSGVGRMAASTRASGGAGGSGGCIGVTAATVGTGGGTACVAGAGAKINATVWAFDAAGVAGSRTMLSSSQPAARCSSIAAPSDAAEGRLAVRGPDQRVAASPKIGGPHADSACRARQYGTL
jgi:hypothetical protein